MSEGMLTGTGGNMKIEALVYLMDYADRADNRIYCGNTSKRSGCKHRSLSGCRATRASTVSGLILP
jgi:predicted GIY-YIG superfamily endonuclease